MECVSVDLAGPATLVGFEDGAVELAVAPEAAQRSLHH